MNNTNNTELFLIGIDYKSSPVEVREKFAFLPHEQMGVLCAFKAEIGAVVCLSTCNRTEIYLSSNLSATEVKNKSYSIIANLKKLNSNLIAEHTSFLAGLEVVNHLFRVSSGLESMILGEGQILNQVKNAYSSSLAFTDNTLNQLFQRALAAGKKVRTLTEISKGAMSVPSAALQIVQKILFPSELSEKNIMVLGAGQIAEICLELLSSQGANHITLVNRSLNHNLQLTKYGINQTISYASLLQYIYTQDLILVCTGAPHYVIEASFFENHSKPIIICDLSLPRNVDPEIQKIPNIKLLDLDFLNTAISQNISRRSSQMETAEEIIKLEIDKFFQWKTKAQQFTNNYV